MILIISQKVRTPWPSSQAAGLNNLLNRVPVVFWRYHL